MAITLDSRLNQEKNIVRETGKTKRVFNNIKMVVGKKVGKRLKNPKNMQSKIFMSKIDYVWQLYSTTSPGRLKNLIAYTGKV